MIESVGSESSGGEIHVLAVDDDDLVRTVLVRQLEHLGYRAFAAATEHEALALLDARHDIRIVVTDLRLGPGRDGRALAARGCARRPGLRIVFMSGHGDEDLSAAGFGDAPVLAKPFRLDELADALATALA